MSSLSILDLPRGCLVHILAFLPLKERLLTSALVSVAWSQAAAAATTSIIKQFASTAECLTAESWAACHAQHLSRLVLTTVHNSTPPCFLQPWLLPALQNLILRGIHLQLGSSSDSHNPLTHLSLLTSLHLYDCSVLPDIRALTALSALQRLQRLTLNLNIRPMQQRSAPAPEWALPGVSTWSHLTALTQLDLKNQHNVTDTVLQDLAASIPHLVQLHLYAGQLSVAGVAHLQPMQNLSTLTLSVGPHLPFTCSTTPVLTLLHNLRGLSLFCWKQLEPALLASMSGLQDLRLKGWSKRQSPEDLPALLGALACMMCLTTLDLQDVLLQANPDSVPLGSAPPKQLDPASFAALTASPQLHTLRLQGAELPQGAWEHVFPPKRPMQHLQELSLGHVSPALGDDALEQLVSCCPGLCVLNLSRVLQSSASLAPLLRLPDLRDLDMKHIHGDSGARVLAQLTGLKCLMNDDANLSPAGLLRLTALTGLRELLMHYSADAWSLPRQVCLHNKAPEWMLPDVWSQLLEVFQQQVA